MLVAAAVRVATATRQRRGRLIFSGLGDPSSHLARFPFADSSRRWTVEKKSIFLGILFLK